MKTFLLIALCVLATTTVDAKKTFAEARAKVEEIRQSKLTLIKSLATTPSSESQKQDCGDGEYSATLNGVAVGCQNCTLFCADSCPSSANGLFYCGSCQTVQIYGFTFNTYLINIPALGGGVCVPCTSNCATGCNDVTIEEANFENLEFDPNYCTACNSGFTLRDGSCDACDQACPDDCPATRESGDYSSYCTSCASGYIFQETDSDAGTGSCSPCDVGCLDACPTTGSSSYCQNCADTHYLYKYSSISTTGECMLCDPNCADACPNVTTSRTYCTACNDGYYLANGYCHKCQAGCTTECPTSIENGDEYCMECSSGYADDNNIFTIPGIENDEEYKDCTPQSCFDDLTGILANCLEASDNFDDFCPKVTPPSSCCTALNSYVDANCEDENEYDGPDDNDVSLDNCEVQVESAAAYGSLKCGDVDSLTGETQLTGDFTVADFGTAFRLAFAIICAADLGIPVANFLVTGVVAAPTKQTTVIVQYSVRPTEDVTLETIQTNLVDPEFLTATELNTQLAEQGVAITVTEVSTDESSIETVTAGSSPASALFGIFALAWAAVVAFLA